MAEWSNAAVLKTVVPQGTGGSNPSSSATTEEPGQPEAVRVCYFNGLVKYDRREYF
jgi:hypothetical protein